MAIATATVKTRPVVLDGGILRRDAAAGFEPRGVHRRNHGRAVPLPAPYRLRGGLSGVVYRWAGPRYAAAILGTVIAQRYRAVPDGGCAVARRDGSLCRAMEDLRGM